MGGREGGGEAVPGEGTDDASLKGWVPPEDRYWRHPSEILRAVGSAGTARRRPAAADDAAPAGPPPPRHHRLWQSAVVGTGAAAVVVGGVMMLLSTDANHGGPQLASAPSGSVTTAPATLAAHVPASARPVADAMVGLEVTDGSSTTWQCAVAVVAGGLVATTADAVRGATSITAVTASGRRVKATVVGVDTVSDVALVRVAAEPPVPPFGDDGSVRPGQSAVVMSMSSTGTTVNWSSTTIESVATALVPSDPSGMAGIVTAATPAATTDGGVLMAPGGPVLGLVDDSPTAARAGAAVFLPTQLFLGVADSLATSGHVRHGWLDATFADVTTTTSVTSTSVLASDGPARIGGALVVTVDPAGPSAAALHPGDVIVAVDNLAVRSMAELRSRLYVLAAGDPVSLEVRHGGVLERAEVDLAASP